MKKAVIFLLACISVISLVSCGSFLNSSKDHTHTPSNWIINVEVTPNSDGERQKKCVDCGKILETEVIPSSSYGSKGLEFTFNERKDGYVVSLGSCKERNIVIPSTYNELPVTNIADYGFAECKFLESVKIPNSILRIGKFAFYFCINLKDIEIPDSVKALEEQAFAGCILIEEISISKNLSELWTTSFMLCNSLKSINVDKDNPYYISIDGNLYSKDKKILIQYAVGNGKEYFEIPNTIEMIAAGAFSFYATNTSYFDKLGPALKEVVIPNSVETIGDAAFSGMLSLEKVNIPQGVTILGAYSFNMCSSLKNITLPDSLTVIGYGAFHYCDMLKFNEYNDVCYLGTENNPYFALIYPKFMYYTEYDIHQKTHIIANSAFANCNMLVSIEIPDSVAIIENSAFYNCTSLKSVTLGKNVRTIESYAFDSCTALTEIVIPISVANVGKYAFNGCDSLKIYCETRYQPSGWDHYWFSKIANVTWGYTMEQNTN